MVLRAFCGAFLLQVWVAHQAVFGREEGRIDTANEYFDNDMWDLVEAGNKPITSLSELTHGIFTLQLAGLPSDCATGTRFVLHSCYIYNCGSDCH